VSNLHRPVMIDRNSGKAACPPYDPASTEQQIFEFWPSDLQRLFAAAGLPRRTPPDSLSDCQTALSSNQQDAPRITSPLTQVTYSLRLSQPQESIALTANAASDARVLYWFAGATLLGQSTPQTALNWRPSNSGQYQLKVSDDQGRSHSRALLVEFLP
jgi:penicillin-binding protein 1C